MSFPVRSLFTVELPQRRCRRFMDALDKRATRRRPPKIAARRKVEVALDLVWRKTADPFRSQG